MQKSTLAVYAVLAASVLAGCATEPGNPDPYKITNRAIYRFNDCIDRAILKPISECYVKITPEPVRTGIGNAFRNLGYLDVIANDCLQGKCRQGWSDTGRLATNSTVGLLGVMDVATGWGMPAHENDFGITLGTWGADSGAYLVLPFLGPSSGRDVWRYPVTVVTDPLFWIPIPWGVSVGLTALDVVDLRARLEPTLKLREQAAIDPYVFTRDGYLQYRQARLAEAMGKPAEHPGLYDEEDGSTTRPATRPATEPAK